MVDGADYFLFCHDDVALFPDTVHLMVEEAFRSNAGIVSPKVVQLGRPRAAGPCGHDRGQGGLGRRPGAAQRDRPRPARRGARRLRGPGRVHPGAGRPVRGARADSTRPSWPWARTSTCAGGPRWSGPGSSSPPMPGSATSRSWPRGRARSNQSLAGGVADQPPGRPVTLQELQRRHELLAVFKCYGPFHLLRVVPQVFLLAVGEVIVAELAGNRARARAVVRAWRWNLSRTAVIRRQRKELKAHRRLGDKEIRLLQVGGSARLAAYGRRVFQHGFHGAHADELAAADGRRRAGRGGRIGPGGRSRPRRLGHRATGGPGGPGGPAGGSGGPGADRASGRLAVWLAAALIVVIGTRGCSPGRCPPSGQFVPFPSWSATLTQFATGWHPSGVGTTAPASPALALAGLLGTVLLGAMGLTQKVLVFGLPPARGLGGGPAVAPVRLPAGLPGRRARLPGHGPSLRRPGPRAVGCPGRLRRHPLGAGPAVPGHRPGPLCRTPPGRRRTRRWRRAPRTASAPGPRPAGGSATGPSGTAPLRSIVALGLLEAVMVSFVAGRGHRGGAGRGVPGPLLLLVGEWRATLRALRLALVRHAGGRRHLPPLGHRRAVRRARCGGRLRGAHPGVGGGVVGIAAALRGRAHR